MSYRYYSTQRPVSLGTFPMPQGNRIIEVKNFDSKRYVDSIETDAWGYIDYEQELTERDVKNYELVAPYDFAFEYGFDSTSDNTSTITVAATNYAKAWEKMLKLVMESIKDDDDYLGRFKSVKFVIKFVSQKHRAF